MLSSSDKPAFTNQQKAFYADPNLVDFVRPGLVIKITSASIASDGTITVQFTITDPKGLPLDRAGITTPGSVSTSFIASYIPSDQEYYVAYTTTTQTSPITKVSAVQPGTDSGGNYAPGSAGQYTYTFATKAPSNFDANATTSIGVYASRDLQTDFGLGTYYANDVFTFVPNGSPVTKVHKVIDTITCNKCHDPLQAHGGARRLLPLCVLCHTMPAIDPDTGNSIQFRQMIHKIHDGAALPSVLAGKPYQIIGFRQSVNDWSDVVFPADLVGEGARNCQMCHESNSPVPGGTPPPGSMTANYKNPPPDAGWWLTRPTIEACGSCHDDVNFATGANHPGGPQPNNNQCANCHIPQGELPFDASIIGAHVPPRFAPGLAGVAFTLDGITNNSAGQSPTVSFTLKDNAGNPIPVSSMNLLNLTFAGPTTDYATEFQVNATKATCDSGGACTMASTTPIPSNATGSWTVGIEGYKSVTLLPGTVKQMTVRDVGQNKILNFSVDGSAVVPHAVEVATTNCNSCHYALNAHGTIRNQTQYCIECHNPNATDASQRPAAQMPAQTIDFPVLIHRIHSSGGIDSQEGGAEAANVEGPYVIYGFNGSVNDFSDVAFPGDLRDCAKCHVNDSQQVPPNGTLQVANPRGFINPEGPTTAACMGCHNAKDTAAHAASMTSGSLGEACGVCHGPDAQFSVNSVHARANP